MYITTPFNHVFAADARTGKELWHFQHKLGKNIFCCGPNNRGVAVYRDTVILGTLDARLIALDKKTGEKVWDVEVADSEVGYGLTAAPVIYKDKIIMGISGGEYGIRGFIGAYNAADGKLVWRWHTIPGPDDIGPDGIKGWEGAYVEKADGINPLNRNIAAEKAAATEFKDSWMRGGAGNWMSDTVDVKRGLIFATTATPRPTSTARTGRATIVVRLAGRARRRDRQAQMGLPVHPARRVGSGFRVAPVLADVKGATARCAPRSSMAARPGSFMFTTGRRGS